MARIIIRAAMEFGVRRSAFEVLVLGSLVLGSLVLVLGSAQATQTVGAAGQNTDWPLHNLDLAGSRFSPLDQINTANVRSLAPRWLFQTGVIDGVSNQTTPVVVNGMMYVTDPRGSVYAL